MLNDILNSSIMDSFNVREKEKDHAMESDSSDSEKESRKKKDKPEKLRKKLYEVVLRKRIFLTDRMEKIEKILINHGFMTEQQLANQQIELLNSQMITAFAETIRSKLKEEKSSLESE